MTDRATDIANTFGCVDRSLVNARRWNALLRRKLMQTRVLQKPKFSLVSLFPASCWWCTAQDNRSVIANSFWLAQSGNDPITSRDLNASP